MPDIIIDAGAGSGGCPRCHHDLTLDSDPYVCGRCSLRDPGSPDALVWQPR